MASLLYRLGSFAFRRRWYATLLWVAILAALGFASAKAPETPPGVLALLGDKVAWLPRRLDRILPHLDVEGEALSRDHPAPTPAPRGDDRTDDEEKAALI